MKLSYSHLIFSLLTDCASKVSLSLLLYICIYCFYLSFFIIIDVLFSNEVSFNVSIGFWSLNELFQKIQRRNSKQRIEEKFSWRLKQILVQISAPNLPQKYSIPILEKNIIWSISSPNLPYVVCKLQPSNTQGFNVNLCPNNKYICILIWCLNSAPNQLQISPSTIHDLTCPHNK